MKNFIFILSIFLNATLYVAQCDVELYSVNWENGDVKIIVHNSNGCGNEADSVYVCHLNLGIYNGIEILNEYEFANYPLHSFLR